MEQDKAIIELLKSRDGNATIVKLENGKSLMVWNIAWGYDLGDEYAHVTTNVSPGIKDATVDFFFSADILEIVNPEDESVIFRKISK